MGAGENDICIREMAGRGERERLGEVGGVTSVTAVEGVSSNAGCNDTMVLSLVHVEKEKEKL